MSRLTGAAPGDEAQTRAAAHPSPGARLAKTNRWLRVMLWRLWTRMANGARNRQAGHRRADPAFALTVGFDSGLDSGLGHRQTTSGAPPVPAFTRLPASTLKLPVRPEIGALICA